MSGGSVVSYRNSTSNHNPAKWIWFLLSLYLIEIPHQTTTKIAIQCGATLLYLIEIPHQTTTNFFFLHLRHQLYLIEIPHQTTTLALFPVVLVRLYLIEIPHQTTTVRWAVRPQFLLYLIEIPHQTTTPVAFQLVLTGCILSKFHIKPQPAESAKIVCVVVSYRNSTSNHNYGRFVKNLSSLYLIEIPHQTTTSNCNWH